MSRKLQRCHVFGVIADQRYCEFGWGGASNARPPRPIFAPPCIVVPSATRLHSALRLDSTEAHRSQARRELAEVMLEESSSKSNPLRARRSAAGETINGTASTRFIKFSAAPLMCPHLVKLPRPSLCLGPSSIFFSWSVFANEYNERTSTRGAGSMFIVQIETLETRRFCSRGGSFDLSFGDHGVVPLQIGSIDYSPVTAPLVEKDAKVVVASSTAVLRYNPDGTLDKSFGKNGATTFRLGSSSSGIFFARLQSDGKILVAADKRLYRLTRSGKTDAAFGGGSGYVHFDEQIHDAFARPDGKIVVALDAGLFGSIRAVQKIHSSDMAGNSFCQHLISRMSVRCSEPAMERFC